MIWPFVSYFVLAAVADGGYGSADHASAVRAELVSATAFCREACRDLEVSVRLSNNTDQLICLSAYESNEGLFDHIVLKESGSGIVFEPIVSSGTREVDFDNLKSYASAYRVRPLYIIQPYSESTFDVYLSGVYDAVPNPMYITVSYVYFPCSASSEAQIPPGSLSVSGAVSVKDYDESFKIPK